MKSHVSSSLLATLIETSNTMYKSSYSEAHIQVKVKTLRQNQIPIFTKGGVELSFFPTLYDVVRLIL